MQTANTSGQFENSVFEFRAIGKIHALLQDDVSPFGVMLIFGLFPLLLFVLFKTVETDSKLILHHMGNFLLFILPR